MKLKILPILLLLVAATTSNSYAHVIRPFTIRYTNQSERGNIVFVANSIMGTQGVGTGNPGTGEPPPAGTSKNNVGAGTYIDADGPVPPAPVTIFNYGSGWKYHDVYATAPPNDLGGNNWKSLTYTEPITWLGPGAGGPYGYNDAQVTTVNTNTTSNRTPTIYFRKTVNIPTPSTYSYITFNVRRDDGCAVYLNGALVSPTTPADVMNFPTTWTHTTLAITDGVEGAADEYISFNVPTTSFVAGNNVIAVEVKNGFVGSNPANKSDLLFDMQLIGVVPTPFNTTFNSSTADLSLASCSNILWAGLYWGAGQGTSGTNTSWITGETTCKLKLPGASSYIDITSTQNDYHNSTLSVGLPHTGYKCFKDITSLMNLSNPNGTYAVANVVGPLGIINSYAGWTIVVVYQNQALPPRNLNVYDGNVIINGGDPAVDVNITGFLTPPSGTVSCELGTVVFDGDRGSTDGYAFQQSGGAGFYDLATTTVPLNGAIDAWNSKISHKGAVVTTRSPAYQNTVGYDASIIDLPNASNAQLGTSKTGATVRFSSPGENYFLQVVTTSISQYDPVFSLDKGSTDLNGGSLIAGDIIRYRINYSNVGNDAAANTIITDNLPVATGFVPGSLKINGVAKTDISGDDQANYDFINRQVIFRLGTGATAAAGGSVAVSGSGYVEFDVYTTLSCEILACGTPTNNIARIDYAGTTSGLLLYDSSGYIVSGCFTQGPISNIITGACFIPGDTILVNQCPVTTVTLPYAKYAGYSFFTAQPFSAATAYNPSTIITQSGTYWAYFNSGGGCHDTIRIRVYINPCPDIDDDDDGLPDYLEMNDPVAFQDADGDLTLNYSDNSYPGYVDYNSDGINDRFDPSADYDNDGTPNFIDPQFPGYIDSNADLVHDLFDKDLDGIPNHLDRDSDNDGIPDVVESFGVDANGDGKIDNYSDTDNDGLSQNVDGNNTGALNSGVGLSALDTDGDGYPNYLDLDSDNDGIPDIVEAFGVVSGNAARPSGYVDADGDGYTDALDGDVGNDNIAENSAATLLRSGTDGNNDGRADTWPYKNMDTDSRPSPYDLDSDGDGITDVKEAALTDADWNGRVDGAVNTDGWNTTVSLLGTLSLPNTEGVGRSNLYDIDSDEDGIPDNVEGLTTLGYLLPANVDTDGDGIDNSYDNFSGFGGDGIHPVDTDVDTVPDYLDLDTDGDGLIDRIEGNDLNFNSFPDDNVTLTGVDTDGDGLDDRFDNDNASAKVTSRYMGNGGTTTGQNPPGSITTVQRSPVAFYGCSFERDWRCIFYILPCEIITVKATLQGQLTKLDWSVLCDQEVAYFIIERSTDRTNFTEVGRISGRPTVRATENYNTTDDVSALTSTLIYYRLNTVLKNGREKWGNIILVKKADSDNYNVQILPNPVRDQLQVLITSPLTTPVEIFIADGSGKIVQKYTELVKPGSNSYTYTKVASLPVGLYYLQLKMGNTIINKKFSVIK